MELVEKDIENLVYTYPWLLDERYMISNIKGACGEVGRQINIGGKNINRFIDLLFKDSRDGRPVIVELKKESLKRQHIGQILEYKALITALDDEKRELWLNEFGKNYYAPKMILIGTEASEEVEISANLSGIEIRVIKGIKELNFQSINEMNGKLNNWNEFINSGNRTLEERGQWVEEVHKNVKKLMEDYENITVSKICNTTESNSYIENDIFPFLNMKIKQNDKTILGFYEYYDENIAFSKEHIYCDVIIEKIENGQIEEEQEIKALQKEVIQYLEKKGFTVHFVNKEFITLKINRKEIQNNRKFKTLFDKLILCSIDIKNIF